ncbi:MAG TPA: proline dehydrogenase family protein [Bryobacteraceae bacterium]|nr:proline dehydrogenase family protein [Bryobacteraceae bacterium]
MLRGALFALSRQNWLRHWVETSKLSKKVTARFVAGETLQQELEICRKLEAEKIYATLDYLGENVTSLAEAEAARGSYLKALDQIHVNGLAATVSVKLTQLGLDLSESACRANAETLVKRAKEIGSRVEFDMESSAYTDRTLAIVTDLHQRLGSVRAVIQAYLYRSDPDIERLSRQGIPVRLCKGAYSEPATVAFPRKTDVDANYIRLMKRLLDGGAYPAIASHDERILDEARRYVTERSIASDRFEFQMLYGIRRDLQRALVRDGYRVRLYVPYGNAWYPYFMRRVAERPANLIFLARNLFRK